MTITFVKKITADGVPCRKCADVEQRLRQANVMDRIDRIVIADERDPLSEGMRLADQYQVDRAPFFLVSDEAGDTKVYTVYFQFLKEVLQGRSSAQDEAAEILDQNPDLDYL